MMVPLDHSYFVRHGLCSRAARLFDATAGRTEDTPELMALMAESHVSMVLDKAQAPSMMFIGKRGPLVKIFGEDWADDVGRLGIPDQEAEFQLNRPYYDVHDRLQPTAHFCIADFTPAGRAPVRQIYQRLLIPLLAPNRPPMILCAVDVLPSSN